MQNFTISDRHVLIKGDDRKVWELWQLNSTKSVRIQLPEYELYLTEDEMLENDDHFPYWLLDPSSTPRYLVCIVTFEAEGFLSGVIVLVFDKLNDPQFLHRLVLPNEYSEISRQRLITTKGVAQTALVIHQNHRWYISDLVNDFEEINLCNSHKFTDDCIAVHGEMYRTESNGNGTDSYHLDISFDAERFLFNESKLQKFDLNDFKWGEIASRCLPYHIGEYPHYPYCELVNATDTRLLWRIRWGYAGTCEDRNCTVRFNSFIEQDFIINSGDQNGNESKKRFRKGFLL